MNFPLLHPATVHFPIGLFFFEMLLLILWMTKKKVEYKHTALICFRTAYIFLILSAITGLIDAGGLDGITGKVRPHFFGAVCVFVVQTFRALHWRFERKETVREANIFVTFSVAAYAITLITGFFGGAIVYSQS